MKIIDYSNQQNLIVSTSKNKFFEIATAAIIFILPVITLFLLAK
jgi:hypothetical protein